MPFGLTGKVLAASAVGFGVTVIVGFVVVVLLISWFSNPPFGLGNAPPQPVAFPHTIHAGAPSEGGMGIQCEFCHRNVTKGAAATVPAVEQCVFCHKIALGRTEFEKAEILKVTQAFAEGMPIDWERVHRVPDHVRFVHEAHIRFFTEPANGQTRTLINGEKTDQPLSVSSNLFRLPRRSGFHDSRETQAGPIAEDGHLPGLPPSKQCADRLHGLPQVARRGIFPENL